MTRNPDRAAATGGQDSPGQEDPRIVISGLDEPEGQEGDPENASPTDEAINRLQFQRERGEPEDEDG